MRYEIISLQMDKKDHNLYIVRLRHIPGWWDRFLGERAAIQVYKGQVKCWYLLPSFRNANESAARFLNHIVLSPDYAHLHTELTSSHGHAK